jgi:hypothetical protein
MLLFKINCGTAANTQHTLGQYKIDWYMCNCTFACPSCIIALKQHFETYESLCVTQCCRNCRIGVPLALKLRCASRHLAICLRQCCCYQVCSCASCYLSSLLCACQEHCLCALNYSVPQCCDVSLLCQKSALRKLVSEYDRSQVSHTLSS